jgi:hypothetical protein
MRDPVQSGISRRARGDVGQPIALPATVRMIQFFIAFSMVHLGENASYLPGVDRFAALTLGVPDKEMRASVRRLPKKQQGFAQR